MLTCCKVYLFVRKLRSFVAHGGPREEGQRGYTSVLSREKMKLIRISLFNCYGPLSFRELMLLQPHGLFQKHCLSTAGNCRPPCRERDKSAEPLRRLRASEVLRTARIIRVARYMPELMILIKGLMAPWQAASSVWMVSLRRVCASNRLKHNEAQR